MFSKRSTMNVAFDGSHCHSSASERIERPVRASRLNSARESFGVSPRRARLAVRIGADRINRSNSDCHTRRADASAADLLMFTFEPMQVRTNEFDRSS